MPERYLLYSESDMKQKRAEGAKLEKGKSVLIKGITPATRILG